MSLADFAEMGELLPQGFAKNSAIATGSGALGVFAALAPVVLASRAMGLKTTKPTTTTTIIGFGTMCMGVAWGRLLYNYNRAAAMGAAGGAVGIGLRLFLAGLLTSDAEITAAAASGVKGLTGLDAMIDGESEGLFPSNYAFP